MELILAKIKELNYEFFGNILPGFIFLVGILVLILLGYLFSGELTQFYSVQDGVLFLKIPSVKATVGTDGTEIVKNFWIVCLAVVLVCSYFFGHFLKWTSKSGAWNLIPFMSLFNESVDKYIFEKIQKIFEAIGVEAKTINYQIRFLRTLFLAKESKVESYHSHFEPFKESVSEMLIASCNAPRVKFDDLNKWPAFYNIARNYVSQNMEKSLTTLYQNKYTYHRSVASAFAIFAWAFLVLSMLLIDIGCFGKVLISLSGFFILTSISRFFHISYEYYWTIWGDHVIADSFIHLLSKREESKK